MLATFAAYAVSRYRFRGRRVFTLAVLSTQMFPGILFLLPLFLIFVSIGNATGFTLLGSRTGLVITYLTFSLPFSIWLLAGYFDSIPRSLDEAAQVDGCGPLRALLRVIIPAAIPGIVTVAIYAFMTAWSEVLFASVMTDDATRTLAVGLRDYSTRPTSTGTRSWRHPSSSASRWSPVSFSCSVSSSPGSLRGRSSDEEPARRPVKRGGRRR